MKRRKFVSLFLSLILVSLAGSGLHFVYDMWPNGITAILAPVRESIWEHIKLLYWPLLVRALVLHRDNLPRLASSLLSLLYGCLLLLVVGGGYHLVLGKSSLAFDLLLYYGLVLFCLWLEQSITVPAGHRVPVAAFTVLLGLLILFFTFAPPEAALFQDLSETAVALFKKTPAQAMLCRCGGSIFQESFS
ncbi:MAG: DUF6512 family protein [Oscillospiraceae bacterium]|nr:DUF6512 family protein [Oscillospiraceae bacterium]